MQADGYVFVELYVEDPAYYVRLFRDALGFTVTRDEGDFVALRSKQGTVSASRSASSPSARPKRGPRRRASRGASSASWSPRSGA